MHDENGSGADRNETPHGRREFLRKTGMTALAAAGGLALGGGVRADELRVPYSAGTARPTLTAPANACDCHIHFYDDRFPAAANATLRPPNATVEDYRLFQGRIGTSRVVIVTPSTYGTDNRPSLEGAARFGELSLPFARWAREHVPALGLLYDEVISGHAVPAYLAFFAVLVTALLLKRTRFGLRIRAVGENPAAVDTAGISVAGLRYAAVAICGLLCGIGGTYLAVAQSAGFLPQMTAGRGFIALAAVIFANWRPVPALGACLLFGLLDAVAIRLQGVSLPGIGLVPVEAIQALPYLMTIVLLAGFIGKATPPKASGIPYVKER